MAQDVSRFRTAQDSGGTYATALAELRAGRKRSHWMWFVFPQVAGLGQSPTAVFFGVDGLAEARAYLADAVLRARLVECCEALLGLPGSDPVAVLGGIDALKLRSSMTLFARASGEGAGGVFRAVLARYFGGEEDPATIALLRP
ncbi:DUF1810 domain-containing protein [Phycicoccus sonneratiae]|uniref:DUF1810 domain-containing protein n=1 Tax=Phycicoccus sonneratiae TaxID=2807628 RepID=A0ABS2CLM6_9MICO|nr:DUF1810 domain-containing protein [Phycicoccus sonneraticus]MBM6400733.1 DUF1810 domain-containing protein [Phycicoccus sonneraticus]